MNTSEIIPLVRAFSKAPTDAQVTTAVDAWLDDHPEATTTVEDGSITNAKLATSFVTPGTAAAYSSSAKYAVGDYCFHNGSLYRSIIPITTAETWTAAHWTAAELGDDVCELKSALSDATGNSIIPITETGKYINITGSTASEAISANFKYSKVECQAGDKFTITAVGAGAARAYGFINSSNGVLEPKAADGETVTNLVVTAPTNAAYLIINNRVTNDYLSYYGELLIDVVDGVNNRVTETNSKIEITNDIVKIEPITSGYTDYAGFWKSSDKTYYENTSTGTRVVNIEADTQYYYTGRNLGSAGYFGIVFFDSNNAVIGGECISSSTQVNYSRRKVMPPSTATKIGFTATKETSANDLNAYLMVEKSAPYNDDNKKFGGDFGFETFPGISDDVIYHIPIYGQSLSTGADAPYYNDGTVSGLFMLGSLDTPEQNLVPLQLTSGAMNPIVPALHDLKAIADQNGKDHYMVSTSSGRGGRSIAQLMSAARQAEIKTARSLSYNIDADNPLQFEVWKNACIYTNAVIKTRLNRALKCPIIVFIQGERDFYTDTELNSASADKPNAYACGDNKALYKQYMGMIKDDMQSFIMTTYSQTEKPLFAIYPCSGDFIKSTAMGVTMAQQEFANENSDVILLAPHYPMPNYGNGHLSTNGYRWLGEYIGRALASALIDRKKEKQLECVGGYAVGTKVYMITDGGYLPLVVDNYTVPQKTNNGFKLYVNGSEATVTSVAIQGNLIVLTSNANMDSATKIEVTYAQNTFGGHGNIRDSAPYTGQFSYLDDTNDDGISGQLSIVYRPQDKDGNALTGEKYPMWNWLVPFYLKIVG